MARSQSSPNPANTTTLFSYHGKLTDQDNANFTGPKAVTFRLWDADTGGNIIWDDTYNVDISNGYFSVLLGKDSDDPILVSDVSSRTELFLEVEIDGEVFTPRDRITPVPYAVHALTLAENAVGTSQLQDDAVTTGKLAPEAKTNIVTVIGETDISTNSPDFLPMENMLAEITTGKAVLEINFGASIVGILNDPNDGRPNQMAFTINLDGVEVLRRSIVLKNQGYFETINLQRMIEVSPGTHNIEIKWKANTYNVAHQIGTNETHFRTLSVKAFPLE